MDITIDNDPRNDRMKCAYYYRNERRREGHIHIHTHR